MKVLNLTALVAVAAFLCSVAEACSCFPATPEEHFTREQALSVHKATVLRAYDGPQGESYYEVKNDETFKGCDLRPHNKFVVEDKNKGNSCQNPLTVGETYILYLDGDDFPGVQYCKGDRNFSDREGAPSANAAYAIANTQCGGKGSGCN